jgi:pSer/pThr/pTyr-binding forkhead associated (FHA) protein
MEPPVPKVPPPPMSMRQQAATKQYALRFISGKYQGGEFPLPPNKEVVVGRSSELDMVLVEDMVSRRHAKLTVTGDQMFIQDLGSTNGTFVNGEKVKRAAIHEGDRILIGTSIIKVVVAGEVASATDAKAMMEDISHGRRTSQVRTMSGSIAEIPLPDLLQLFSASKKSGVLVIRTDRNDTGKLFIDTGRVVFAVVNEHYDVAPMKSLMRILGWQTGTFDMDPPEETKAFPTRIEMSTEGILMEAMRQIDEIRRLGDDMPPLRASVQISVPLVPPLRDLGPEEIDVLQLAHNYASVETVLNKSLASDVDTSTILVKLLKSGYLRAE